MNIWERTTGYIGSIFDMRHGAPATYVGNNRVLIRCLINGLRIAYYVEADDRLLAPWFIVSGKYETELTRYFVKKLKKTSHCIDVGANFGYFNCLMARICSKGKVIAIEADKHIYEIVRDNIFINGFNHAHALHAAAGSDDKEITLYRRVTRSGNTSIVHYGPDLTESLGETPEVPFVVKSMRLDGLSSQLEGRVDFIKIDVEGAEPLVIEGASQVINDNNHLEILMEWSPGQIRTAGFDLGDFVASLENKRLKPSMIERGRVTRISYGDLINLPYQAGVLLKR